MKKSPPLFETQFSIWLLPLNMAKFPHQLQHWPSFTSPESFLFRNLIALAFSFTYPSRIFTIFFQKSSDSFSISIDYHSINKFSLPFSIEGHPYGYFYSALLKNNCVSLIDRFNCFLLYMIEFYF